MRPLATLLLALLLGACPQSPPPSVPPAAPASAVPTTAPPSGDWVHVRSPRDRALTSAPARTLPGTNAVEQVAASFPLRVVRVHVQPGDVVAAGDPIVDVTSTQVLTAAATYGSASQALRLHETRLATLRGLHDERMASAAQVFELEAARAELVERKQGALAVLRAAGVSPGAAGSVLAHGSVVLRASVGGIVRDLHAIVGEVHADGQVFASIVGGSSTRVEARFAQAMGPGFRYEFEDLRGRVTPLGDAPTRTLDAGDEGGVYMWFDVPPSAELAPDAPGHAQAIAIDARYLEVPVDSLAPGENGPRVMRRRGGATREVPVVVIATSGTSAIVTGDLTTSDEVAADGASLLVPREPGGEE